MAKTDTIIDRFQGLHAGSARLYEESLRTFPSGVTHDLRYLQPFPLFIDRAQGSRKWDVDGNEYIDYVMGHGALLLGHAHPEITQAVIDQAQKGTHYGGNSRLEVEWGETGAGNRAVRRGGAIHELRHGGDADGVAARPCLHRTRPNPEV